MIIFSIISTMAVASSPYERVTVTMPAELVAGVDRYESNRSRFITEAVRHELKRRRHLELLRSLDEPHPDSLATAALGLEAWGEALPTEDSDLLDPTAGATAMCHQKSLKPLTPACACIWALSPSRDPPSGCRRREGWR